MTRSCAADAGPADNMTPDMMREHITGSGVAIKQAIARGNMDLAQTLASRNVGWRVLLGEIPVKLRHIRL